MSKLQANVASVNLCKSGRPKQPCSRWTQPAATHLHKLRLTSISLTWCVQNKSLVLFANLGTFLFPLYDHWLLCNVLPTPTVILSALWRRSGPHHSCCTLVSYTPNCTHTSANTSTSHLHTEPPEVSTFWNGKQAWELLSDAAQASGITGAHNMTLPQLPYTHIHIRRAVNISNIFLFPLAGRQQSSRSSQEQSPSRVMIGDTLYTPREMTHHGRCHCVWGTDWGPWSSNRRWSLGWRRQWRCRAHFGRSGLQSDSHL